MLGDGVCIPEQGGKPVAFTGLGRQRGMVMPPAFTPGQFLLTEGGRCQFLPQPGAMGLVGVGGGLAEAVAFAESGLANLRPVLNPPEKQ